MALSIRNPRTEALAREVAREAGESLTEAITVALEERLQRVRGARTAPDLLADIMEISRRCGALPTVDKSPEDELLGYTGDGAPEPW